MITAIIIISFVLICVCFSYIDLLQDRDTWQQRYMEQEERSHKYRNTLIDIQNQLKDIKK